MFKAFIKDLAICALQIGTSVLLLVAFSFSVFAVTKGISYEPDDWHRTFASVVTTGLAVYAAVRIGLKYGSLENSLPPLWFVSLILIVLGLLGAWALVLLGAFDFSMRLLSPLSDYWLPADFPGEGFVVWTALATKFVGACAVICAVSKLILFLSTKQVPEPADPTPLSS